MYQLSIKQLNIGENYVILYVIVSKKKLINTTHPASKRFTPSMGNILDRASHMKI